MGFIDTTPYFEKKVWNVTSKISKLTTWHFNLSPPWVCLFNISDLMLEMSSYWVTVLLSRPKSITSRIWIDRPIPRIRRSQSSVTANGKIWLPALGYNETVVHCLDEARVFVRARPLEPERQLANNDKDHYGCNGRSLVHADSLQSRSSGFDNLLPTVFFSWAVPYFYAYVLKCLTTGIWTPGLWDRMRDLSTTWAIITADHSCWVPSCSLKSIWSRCYCRININL